MKGEIKKTCNQLIALVTEQVKVKVILITHNYKVIPYI
jgi:hypothetical protein